MSIDAGARVLVIAPVGGTLRSGRQSAIVERTFDTARSVEFDAVLVAHDIGDVAAPSVVLLQEAYRHCKPLGAWGSGRRLLADAGIFPDAPGVLVGNGVNPDYVAALIAAVGLHRVWDRLPLLPAPAGQR